MQKLKVYLTKTSQQNKTTLDKLKLSILKTKPFDLQPNNNNKTNNNSSNNLIHSNNIQHNISFGYNNYHGNNIKKRTMSNMHNRSLQQIYDFRAEVRSVIRDSNRYEKFKEYNKKQSNLDKNKEKDKRGLQDHKKNSKNFASQGHIQYRSQPHRDLDKILHKNNKSQKKYDDFTEKKANKSSTNNQPHKIKSIINLNNNSIQNFHVENKKNTGVSKMPVKKRSKSANPQNKKPTNSVNQISKQKRSRSTMKVNKNMDNLQLQSSLKNSYSMLGARIEFRSMFRTRKGVQIMNPNKVNQDRLYVKQNILIADQRNLNIYAVADGHGPSGHFVSHLIVDNLHTKIDHHLKKTSDIQQSLKKSYNDIQSMLVKSSQFSAEFSGSTLVTLIIQNNKKLYCANVGDSRAIVAKQLNKTSWEVIRLSNDHKPNLEQQRKRILAHGGRIQTVYDEQGKNVGPLRVWLPKKQIQGLAMSRSLGDNISKPYGVTHIPQILTYQLTKNDKFILLASDGVWQFLTNYQILSLIIPYYRQRRLQDACQALMKQSHRSWTKQDNSVVDDISFILIFLDYNQTNTTFINKQQQVQKIQKNKKNSQCQWIQNKNYEQIQNKIQEIQNNMIKNQKDISSQDSLQISRLQPRVYNKITQQKDK